MVVKYKQKKPIARNARRTTDTLKYRELSKPKPKRPSALYLRFAAQLSERTYS